ncbi:MAG: hypothetical protein IH626_24605, partial [Rhodospirillales bacterium]|nr:hypothetical protein [Rhodospirillales bacterium]
MPSTPETPIRVRAQVPGHYRGHRRAGEEFDFAAGSGPLPKWLKPAPADPLAAAIAALDPNDETQAAGRRLTRNAAPK